MIEPKRISMQWSGSRAQPLVWSDLSELFEIVAGPGRQSLPKYPDVIGWSSAQWYGEDGIGRQLEDLADLRSPFEDGEVELIVFSHNDNLRTVDLALQPGERSLATARIDTSSD